MADFIERKTMFLPVLQPLVQYLIATDVIVPNVLRHALKTLVFVDIDTAFSVIIPCFLNSIFPASFKACQWRIERYGSFEYASRRSSSEERRASGVPISFALDPPSDNSLKTRFISFPAFSIALNKLNRKLAL